MSPPTIALTAVIGAALDPVLIVVAVLLGWRADQAGKIAIAALAALGTALLVDALFTALGLPWMAPLSRDGPMMLQVRAVAAVVYAALAYGAARISARRRAVRE